MMSDELSEEGIENNSGKNWPIDGFWRQPWSYHCFKSLSVAVRNGKVLLSYLSLENLLLTGETVAETMGNVTEDLDI